MTRHAQAMDAKAYWNQFVTAFYFEAPGDEISGVIVALQEEGPLKDPEPRLIIQTKDGKRRSVVASQERLKGLLQEEAPAVGDWIGIRYTGDAERAMAGKNPAKLFTVVVRRQGSQPPGGTEKPPPAASENAPGVGK